MTVKLLLIDTDEIHRYSLGAEHPMGPNRVDAALKLSHQLGILDAFEVSQPEGATDEILELVHSKAYIQATRANQSNPQFGIGTVDNPVAMLQVASAAVLSMRLARCGKVRQIVRLILLVACTMHFLILCRAFACITTLR